jgi:predicted Rossmann fold nucleotide-binding protein DprA/Smf involved in DNA uptake
MPATLQLHTISSEDAAYPTALKTAPAFKIAPALQAIGTCSVLQNSAIALFCSTQCPDDLICKTYDLVQALRQARISTISGFHSPVERHCFDLLLNGTSSMIYCPARSLQNLRLSPEQQRAIESDRLLILSPFSSSYSRSTVALAAKRNQLVGAIAQIIVISYAASGSKTLALAQRFVKAGKSVITFHSPANTALQQQGIASCQIDEIIEQLKSR